MLDPAFFFAPGAGIVEEYEDPEVVARIYRYCNGQMDESWLGDIPQDWTKRIYSTQSEERLKGLIIHATIMLVRLERKGRKDAAG